MINLNKTKLLLINITQMKDLARRNNRYEMNVWIVFNIILIIIEMFIKFQFIAIIVLSNLFDFFLFLKNNNRNEMILIKYWLMSSYLYSWNFYFCLKQNTKCYLSFLTDDK